MALKISLKKNNLTTTDKPYYFRARVSEVVTQEAFIENMAQGRTTLSKPDIRAAMQLLQEELTKYLAQGCKVKTQLGDFYPVVQGTAQELEENFCLDQSNQKNALKIHFDLSRKIYQDVKKNLLIQNQEPEDLSVPNIQNVMGFRSGPEIFVCDDVVTLQGRRLKFDPLDIEQGVFLATPGCPEIRLTLYVSLRPSEITLILPELGSKEYWLSLRTKPNGNVQKSFTWPHKFTIQ